MLTLKLADLITPKLVTLQLSGTTREDIVLEMVQALDEQGRLNDKQGFTEAVCEREKEGSTGIGFGIAIPHGKTNAVPERGLWQEATGRDWNSLDGEPAHLVFLLTVPESRAGNEHRRSCKCFREN